jgi:hypothetical protein
MPAMTALAGLVPWADWGIRQMAVVVAPLLVVFPNHQQARVFALGPGVGLERNARQSQ